MRVYVFGPGWGESIVLEYPKNSKEEMCWGVIDCYQKPVLDFLQDRGVKELEFICWTHPHADHHNGLPDLLEEYEDRIKRFWRFGGYNAHILVMFYDVLTRKESVIEGHRATYKRLKRIFDFAKRQQDRNRDSFKILSDIHNNLINIKYNDKCSFCISSLSPSTTLVDEYTSRIGKCLHQVRESKEDFNFNLTEFDGSHNNVSTILLVEFGQTRLLFGADAVEEVWNDVFVNEERLNTPITLNSNFVKISHHGSEGAYHRDSWLEIADTELPHAVVTPFDSSDLPRNEVLNVLRNHCRTICLTATNQNFHYYPTKSIKTKLSRKWRIFPDNKYCMFEYDQFGNLNRSEISDTALVI